MKRKNLTKAILAACLAALGWTSAALAAPESVQVVYPPGLLKSGDVVSLGFRGTAAEVPARGMTVGIDWIYPDGGDVLEVRHMTDGTVIADYSIDLDDDGIDPSAENQPTSEDPDQCPAGAVCRPATSPAACSDGAFNRLKDQNGNILKWQTVPVHWRIRFSQIPSYLNQDNTIQAFREGMNTWPIERNDCGRVDVIVSTELSNSYDGNSGTVGTSFTSSNACGTSDGQSVVSFANFPSTDVALARTCWWFFNQPAGTGFASLESSDIRFNTDYSWWNTLSTCDTRWLTRPVMAHESGHLYGMDHVLEGSTATSRCRRTWRGSAASLSSHSGREISTGSKRPTILRKRPRQGEG